MSHFQWINIFHTRVWFLIRMRAQAHHKISNIPSLRLPHLVRSPMRSRDFEWRRKPCNVSPMNLSYLYSDFKRLLQSAQFKQSMNLFIFHTNHWSLHYKYRSPPAMMSTPHTSQLLILHQIFFLSTNKVSASFSPVVSVSFSDYIVAGFQKKTQANDFEDISEIIKALTTLKDERILENQLCSSSRS